MGPSFGEGNKARAARGVRLTSVAILVTACAADPQPLPRVSRSIIADVIVTIDNQTRQGMVIYVEAGTTRDSLGIVPRGSSRTFPLPSAVGDSTSLLRLEAHDSHARSSLRSDVFRLASAHQVVWTIRRNGNASVTMR